MPKWQWRQSCSDLRSKTAGGMTMSCTETARVLRRSNCIPGPVGGAPLHMLHYGQCRTVTGDSSKVLEDQFWATSVPKASPEWRGCSILPGMECGTGTASCGHKCPQCSVRGARCRGPVVAEEARGWKHDNELAKHAVPLMSYAPPPPSPRVMLPPPSPSPWPESHQS